MTTLKIKYENSFKNFLQVIPMDDPFFVADLIGGHMFPGDTKDQVKAKPTKAEKTTEFLSKCIEPAFSDDGNTNVMLDKLLDIMEKCGFEPAADLAKNFKSGSSGITTNLKGLLNEKPKFTDLKLKFNRVADWESICPFLLNDDDGQRTKLIGKGRDAEEARAEMLLQFLMDSNPTWKKVIDALRQGRYNNVADELEAEM